MTELTYDIEELQARNDAVHALMDLGWSSRRIALALGMYASWETALRVMYLGETLDLTAFERVAAE